MYESFWDFEWPLDAGAECCARTWRLWRRASWKQVGDVTEGLRECEPSRWGAFDRMQSAELDARQASRAAVFPAGNNNATALCCHGTSTKDVICCRRSSRQNSYTWNCGPQPCYFFFVCWCLSKESWVVYSLFLLNMVTCLWLASFVVANDGTPPAVFGKFSFISTRNLKGTLWVI